jgi:tRNA G18 (ribose-2'-O)-methylase SpoU
MNELSPAADPRLATYAHVGDAAWLRRQGLFVAEGRLVVERMIDTGRFAIESILVTPAAKRALSGRLEEVDAPVLLCSPETLSRITGFNFHRGCLALARRPPTPAIDSWLAREGALLALEGVGNPDNVGGLFRTAAAFGACGILVSPSTADPLYRKAIRTSMGAVLQLPWTTAEPWPEALATLRSHGWRVAALTPHADAISIVRFVADDHRRVVLLLGAEGSGLTEAALSAADDRIRIPIAASVDSLNVTVAAGIALHALWQNRRTPNPQNLEPLEP